MIRILLSGGMDSAACLAWAAIKYGRAIDAVFFTYGQRHEERERVAMSRLCNVYGINKWFVPLGRIAGSSLTDLEGKLSGAGVVVPDRNAIMLRQAAALFPGPEAVVMGCCRDDWEVFEDCRPEFFDKMRAELAPCKIITPLIDLDKRGVYRFAQRYGGSALLDLSWSCYAGGAEPCGSCGACEARARGIPADLPTRCACALPSPRLDARSGEVDCVECGGRLGCAPCGICDECNAGIRCRELVP